MAGAAPTITAVLFNYNYADLLPQSLEMVANQSVAPDEIIIIDDASTDNSAAVIQAFIEGRPEIRFIQNQPNKGIIATQNFAVEVASSDFVFFVASDDWYSLDIIKWCREVLSQYPDVVMISGNAATHDTHNTQLRKLSLPFPRLHSTGDAQLYSAQDIETAARSCCMTFFGGANIMRRDVMLQFGGYLPELKWHCDWLLYLLLAHHSRFAVLPRQFVSIRQAQGQYSLSCYVPEQQEPVTRALIHTLKTRYAEHYSFFKQSALLPIYNLHVLKQLVLDKSLRDYLTPLLVWRLVSFGLLSRAGRVVPRQLGGVLRRLLRI